MKPFLQTVAEDIIQKHGTNLSDIAVVFPNKRASIFMNQHLLNAAGKPLWSPRYITISELFRSKSELTVADKIKSIAMLYDVYQEHTQSAETLDRFWGWGEIMLADFDDMDKNMGQAELIFNNVRDLHAFDSIDFLDEEKRELLKRFFSEFSDNHDSKLKQRFEKLWQQLPPIYNDFNTAMREQNLAYEGALYREVAERCKKLEWEHSKYIFVGFNMIQKVEQVVFSNLRDKGKACFYWDFDHYYKDNSNQEAGHFINQYLVEFPNEIDIKDEETYNNFSKAKDVTFLSAATENIQARYAGQWLKENGRLEAGQRTAIVLADESLLQSVIHYLPAEISGRANITIGYPLSLSPITSLVKDFLALHIHGYNAQRQVFMRKYVVNMLHHPYVHNLSEQALALPETLQSKHIHFPSPSDLCLDEGLKLLFEPIDQSRSEMSSILLSRLLEIMKAVSINNEQLIINNEQSIINNDASVDKRSQDHLSSEMLPFPIGEGTGERLSEGEAFLQESVYRMHNVLNRLNDLISVDGLSIDPATLLRLIDQITGQTTMPFHGEPAVGVQIMGVLETRNLDFDHLLILSCNEGNLPKGINDSSLIPYSIRKAHELTTIDNKVAIYAYYFYRLMQRASDITITYNSSTEDGNTGQMSRFMLQMMVETDPVRTRLHNASLTSSQAPSKLEPGAIVKDEAVMRILDDIKQLSPSALNKYLRCPKLFYYDKVVGLKETQTDNIDDRRLFGNIFHKAAELMYSAIRTPQNEITKEAISLLLGKEGSACIQQFVDDAFSQELFNGRKPHYDGLQLINREVVCTLIRQLLKADLELAPFHIEGLEARAYEDMTFTVNGQERTFTIGGFIDRLDRITDDGGGEVLRVVDYKTGSKEQKILAEVEEVFNPEKIEGHSDYYLQAMLYSIIVARMAKPYDNLPALNPQSLPVKPALIFVQRSKSVSDPVLKFGKGSEATPVDNILAPEYSEPLLEGLNGLIEQIFNPQNPFSPTTVRKRCENCAFAGLCKV